MMQLIVDIKDDKLAKKIIKILDAFKDDRVKIKSVNEKIEKNQEYDVDYEHSYQYKLDRAEFEEIKRKL